MDHGRHTEGAGGQAMTRRPPYADTREQKQALVLLLTHGAQAQGYAGDVWTLARVVDLVEWTSGVHFHPATMSDLLRELGWTWQIPRTRARQRDKKAINAWHQEAWPALKKVANTEQAIIWIDEASVYLLPMAVHTFALCGQTTRLRAKLSHNHPSVSSALSQEGQVWFALQPASYDSVAGIAFL